MAESIQPDWNTAKNILCVRLDSMGDVIMTSPAIRAVKEGLSGRRITLLTSPSGAGAAALIPHIDEVIEYEAPWMKSTAYREDGRLEYQMADRLREGGFDAAIIFTVFSQNPLPAALLCYLADIPLRMAYCRENPYQLLTDWVIDQTQMPNIPHEVRRQLDLVERIRCRVPDERLSIQPPPLAYSHIVELLEEKGLDPSKPWVVMNTAATAPSRCYEPESFAEVGRCLSRDHGIQVVFSGDGPDNDQIEAVRNMMAVPSISLVGQTNVGELAALLDCAPLLISNNSGPVHLACAVGTPVVDLYALTNPQHTPWGVPYRVLNHDVPCKYCFHSICPEVHHNCLRLVTPEQVVSATVELMQETAHFKGSAPQDK